MNRGIARCGVMVNTTDWRLTCVLVWWCGVVFEEVAIEYRYRIQSLLLIHYSQKL